VDDPFFGRDDLRRAWRGSLRDAELLLAHSPVSRSDARKRCSSIAGDPPARGEPMVLARRLPSSRRQPDISFESGGVIRCGSRDGGWEPASGRIRLIPATDPELARYPSGDHSAPPRTSGEIDLDPCDRGARSTGHGL